MWLVTLCSPLCSWHLTSVTTKGHTCQPGASSRRLCKDVCVGGDSKFTSWLPSAGQKRPFAPQACAFPQGKALAPFRWRELPGGVQVLIKGILWAGMGQREGWVSQIPGTY